MRSFRNNNNNISRTTARGMVKPNRRVQSGRVATNGNHQVVQRSFWQIRSDVRLSSEVTEAGQSYLSLGSSYLTTGINYRIREFIDSTFMENYDMYRIKRIQIFATKNDDARNITVYSSFDYDDSNPPTWAEVARRQNVRTTTLKINEPRKLIATFTPVVNFTNTGSAGADSPQNVVATNNPWIDSSASNQSYNGIKIFATAQNPFSLTFHARVSVEYKSKQ